MAIILQAFFSHPFVLLCQDWAYTALPGGISGRRFSGLYLNPGFFEGHYKTVEGIKPMH